MLDLLIDRMHDTKFLTMLFASVAAVATVLTLAMPLLSPDIARQAHEVGRARAREDPPARARAAGARREGKGHRSGSRPSSTCQKVVERFNLTKWLAQEEAREKLVQAGYRGQAPYVAFLFFRMVTPAVLFLFALFYLFVVVRVRPAADRQVRDLPRRRLCRHAAALSVPQEPHRQAPALDQARLSGRARPAADLRRIRHVDRGGVQEGQPGDRLAVDRAGRGADADHRRAVLPAGPQAGLRESRQAHRSRRRQVGLHGAAAGRALRHAARPDAARACRRKTATCACRKPRRRPPRCRPS